MSTPKDPDASDDASDRAAQSLSKHAEESSSAPDDKPAPPTNEEAAQGGTPPTTEDEPGPAATPPVGEWWEPTHTPPDTPVAGQWGAQQSGQPTEPRPWGADSQGSAQSWSGEPPAPGQPSVTGAVGDSAPQDDPTRQFSPGDHTQFGTGNPPAGQPYPSGAQQPYPPSGPPHYPPGGVFDNSPTAGPQNPPYGSYPSYPQQYQPYGAAQPQSRSQLYSIIGFVCAAAALLFCPILFGPAGIALGIVGHNKGESLGKWAAIAAGVGMVVGFIIGFVVFSGDFGT
ncbi:hypothetical protein AB0C34_15855 [Nocardia sp. NPDC049220]|uniref:hypothetical protein n=1 Tax=Nocardia sp. NPDC049220 TaxID=3155273 RepID=UPI00340221AC